MNTPTQPLIVEREIVIDAPADHVFKVFTDDFGRWWPKSHHLGGEENYVALIEPHIGGRWYERGESGAECDWGRVLVWDPPHQLVLAWQISSEWRPDPSVGAEVAIEFVSETDRRTRVKLQHRNFETYGENAQLVADSVSGQGGWGSLLAMLKEAAEEPKA